MPTPEPQHLSFRKSSYSSPQNCVEVADLPTGIAMRDSKHPEKGHFSLPTGEWTAFLDVVKRSEV